MVFLKEGKRGVYLTEVFRPSDESAKAVSDAFMEAVMVKPVLAPHVGEHSGEGGGEIRFVLFQLLVCVVAEAEQ